MALANTTPVLELTLDNGKKIPLRVQTSQKGNAYWAVLASRADGSRYYNRRGVMVDANVVGDKLPKAITFGGTEIPLASGKSEKGKAKVSATATVHVPGVGKKQLSFRITVVDDGTGEGAEGPVFNLDAIVNGGNGGFAVASSL